MGQMTITGKAKLFRPGAPDESWGYGEAMDLGHESDKNTIKDGSGSTAIVVHTDFRTKYSGTYKALKTADDATNPATFTAENIIGKILEIKPYRGGSAIKILIDDAQLKYKAGGEATFSYTGYIYSDIDLEAPNSQEVIADA